MSDIGSFRNNWENSLKKGLFQLLVLSSIRNHSKEGTHGIQILQEINEISEKTLSFSVGTIYPFLKQLENLEIVEKIDVTYSDGKQKRKKKLYRPKNNFSQFDNLYTYVSNRWSQISTYVNQFSKENHITDDKYDFSHSQPTLLSEKFLIELALLSVLVVSEKPIMAPELPQLLKNKFGSKHFVIHEGKIYPYLQSMEARKLVTRFESQDYNSDATGQVSYIFYLITDSGSAYLRNIMDQWDFLTNQIEIIRKLGEYKN